MSEGDAQPPTMVVAEAHNIGQNGHRLERVHERYADLWLRYLPCSQANV